MAEDNREPFLLWSGSMEYLSGRSAPIDSWLCHCGRFKPVWSWQSPWPGTVVAGLSLLMLVACVSLPVTPNADAVSGSVWLIAISLVVGLASIANAIQSWRGRRWRMAARRAGRLIVGMVTHASGWTVTFAGSREEGTGEPRTFHLVTIEYEFCTPEGERIWATDEAVRNDLEGGLKLPQTGHPVLILYLAPHRFVML